jgi:hypothetical protein
VCAEIEAPLEQLPKIVILDEPEKRGLFREELQVLAFAI